jgi:DNA-binding transcriptional LysR family regulator
MIAVRIGPDIRIAVVGAPTYFETRSEPKTPQDLLGHNCINLRLPTRGGLYAWEFEQDERELKVHVEGQLVFNGTFQMLNAALAGCGLAYVPEMWRGLISLKADSDGCSRTGARLMPAITFIIPVAGKRRRPSHYWSRRCATNKTARLSKAPRCARWQHHTAAQNRPRRFVADHDRRRIGSFPT